MANAKRWKLVMDPDAARRVDSKLWGEKLTPSSIALIMASCLYIEEVVEQTRAYAERSTNSPFD